MDEKQRTKFLGLVSINGYWDTSLSSELREKLFNAMTPVLLKESWASLQKLEFDKAASEHLASVGAVRFVRDRETLLKDLSQLMDRMDGAKFLILTKALPKFKLQLSREEFRLIAQAAKQSFTG